MDISETWNYQVIIMGKFQMLERFLTLNSAAQCWYYFSLLMVVRAMGFGASKSLDQGLGNGSGRPVCGIPPKPVPKEQRGKMSSSSFCRTPRGGTNELCRIFFSPLLDFLLLRLGICQGAHLYQDGPYRAADGCHCGWEVGGLGGNCRGCPEGWQELQSWRNSQPAQPPPSWKILNKGSRQAIKEKDRQTDRPSKHGPHEKVKKHLHSRRKGCWGPKRRRETREEIWGFLFCSVLFSAFFPFLFPPFLLSFLFK